MRRTDIQHEMTGLTRLRERAAALGWQCFAEAWEGYHTRYWFECAEGHRFKRQATIVLYDAPQCPGCKVGEIRQRFYDRLGKRSFTCLEADFLGMRVRHRFSCVCGHEWTTRAGQIMQGSGCPTCAYAALAAKNTRADGLERMQRLATDRGGRCLAERYEGTRAYYEWECAAGHRWQAIAARIVQGGWCARCGAQRQGETLRAVDGLERLRAVASSRGGEVVDPVYEGLNSRYTFRCARGHEWQTRGERVLHGSWCKRCVNLGMRRTIESMQQIASERGGRCLSAEYLGNTVRLLWECHRGHVWQAIPRNVINGGHWCPICFRLRTTKNPEKRLKYDFEG